MNDSRSRSSWRLSAPQLCIAEAESRDGCRSFQLKIEEIDFRPTRNVQVRAWGVNGSSPAPLLVAYSDDLLAITFHNLLSEDVGIHWRGVAVHEDKAANRAVSTGANIPPGESATHRFTATTPGTFLFHAHMNQPRHLNKGIAGMLVVLPREPDGLDRDFAFLLQGWSIQKSKSVPGLTQNQMDWLSHRVIRPLYELSPTNGNSNYFTINGKSFPDTIPLRVREGERVKFRFGNVSQTHITVHIHGHKFQVVACDGFPLPQPWWKHSLTIHPGESWDIVMVADHPGNWVVQAEEQHCLMNGTDYPGGILTTIRYSTNP